MPRRACSLFLIGFLLAAPVSAQPRFAPTGGTPLERHREPAVRSTPAPVIAGRVALVQQGAIVTSVSSQDLDAHGLGDGDRVSLGIGGQTLAARLMSMPTYLALVGDPAAADTLDVDILGVIDDRGPGEARLVILALGGGIAEWLSASPGMPLTVRTAR